MPMLVLTSNPSMARRGAGEAFLLTGLSLDTVMDSTSRTSQCQQHLVTPYILPFISLGTQKCPHFLKKAIVHFDNGQ